MKRRTFLQTTAALAAAASFPASAMGRLNADTLRTAHIGLGYQGMEDLKAVASHPSVVVTALCDVDAKNLAAAAKLYPDAKTYADYRDLMRDMESDIDAVVVATPDHAHAPASMLAMEMDKAVYCQKPLTHHVTEARAMRKVAADKGLVTQMGIQVHSFYDYRMATELIRSGIIGKVKTVRAWSNKNWGYDGPPPTGSDPIPEGLNWDLWLGTSAGRPYKADVYHPGNWRKLVDFGCGTLGDMGVHIFDTPYNALELDIPKSIKTECRPPNRFSFPERNTVTYKFPGTRYTTKKFKWVWYDGTSAPDDHKDLRLPNGDELPEQGAMFIGEKGRLLLPHFMQLPKVIVKKEYRDITDEVAAIERDFKLGAPVRNYDVESKYHYHQFVDACLGKDEVTAPFSYAGRLTETILLGTIAGRFPGKTLHWDNATARFREEEANVFLDAPYREF